MAEARKAASKYGTKLLLCLGGNGRSGARRKVEEEFRDRSGRWEDYKSEAELEDERLMEHLKGQYYPKMKEEF